LVAVPDMNRRKVLAVLSMLPLAGSVAGIAGAATPDLRLAKLAWIGERLAGSSESDIRHWLDRLESGEALPSVLRDVRAAAARDFGAGQVMSAGGVRLARSEAALAQACHAHVIGGVTGA
jgi:hypothetical protein